jgi:hypothetical protein
LGVGNSSCRWSLWWRFYLSEFVLQFWVRRVGEASSRLNVV